MTIPPGTPCIIAIHGPMNVKPLKILHCPLLGHQYCIPLSQSAVSDFSSLLQKLKLESKWACPDPNLTSDKTASQNSNKDGLSTGSVLVILFFVFTTLYFVGGAVALKLLRGAEGREMIPNYDFWVDLPHLVSVSVCWLCSY